MRRLPLHRLGSLATVAIVAAATLGTAAACGSGDDTGASDGKPVTLRLGYFPNITHAPAIVGVEKGIFADKLGSDVKLETKTFNA
ncbi:MAG TPA: sulfonate ABC transporter substrate-binding protein, partial [Asanoa sp.]|nr:sulfonate ABC transporter substrate-binding protein [Asanoa sp.]